MTSHTFHDCCHAVIREADKRPQAANLHFARGYAKVGLAMPDAAAPSEATEEVRAQCLYIRANLQGWSGEEARAVKRSLDKIGGIK